MSQQPSSPDSLRPSAARVIVESAAERADEALAYLDAKTRLRLKAMAQLLVGDEPDEEPITAIHAAIPRLPPESQHR